MRSVSWSVARCRSALWPHTAPHSPRYSETSQLKSPIRVYTAATVSRVSHRPFQALCGFILNTLSGTYCAGRLRLPAHETLKPVSIHHLRTYSRNVDQGSSDLNRNRSSHELQYDNYIIRMVSRSSLHQITFLSSPSRSPTSTTNLYFCSSHQVVDRLDSNTTIEWILNTNQVYDFETSRAGHLPLIL